MENKWRGSALCAQTDPEVFFPQNKAYVDDYNGYDNYNAARKISSGVPSKRRVFSRCADDWRRRVWHARWANTTRAVWVS